MVFSSKGNSKFFPLATPRSEEERLYARVLDKDTMSKKEALAYARIYQDLAPEDPYSLISVKRVQDFLEQILRKAAPGAYQKIITYYKVIEGDDFPKAKIKKIKKQIEDCFESSRSLKNAMMYSASFEKAANEMASKLDAPKEMSVLERVKWLRIWIVLLKDSDLFWADLNEKGLIVGPQISNRVNSLYFFPEVLIHLNNIYFSHLDDEEIILENIQNFLAAYPEEIQKEVLRFAELDYDTPYNLQLGRIRVNLKQQLFPNSCRSELSYFMTKTGIQHFTHEHLRLAVTAYRNGGLPTMPEMTSQIVDVFANFKKKNVNFYKYGEITLKGKTIELGVSSAQELEMYVILYRWLLARPDFKFGIQNKTLAEYGMDNLLADPKLAVSAWILDSGYATDESDINWDLAEIILKPNENEALFSDYFKGQISAQEVFNTIGFNTEKLARMCCSFKGLICFDKADFDRVFRRVHMFGISKSSVSDCIYVELYKFLLKTNIPCGEKRKPISMHGLRYSI